MCTGKKLECKFTKDCAKNYQKCRIQDASCTCNFGKCVIVGGNWPGPPMESQCYDYKDCPCR